MITIKTLSWIIATIIFVGYNVLFNKGEGSSSSGYGTDLMPIFRFGLTSFGYLIFWIIWLIIF